MGVFLKSHTDRNTVPGYWGLSILVYFWIKLPRKRWFISLCSYPASMESSQFAICSFIQKTLSKLVKSKVKGFIYIYGSAIRRNSDFMLVKSKLLDTFISGAQSVQKETCQ